ncbi:MAG: YggS family pyridoxal phosphate-dependent enzyme [Nocardioidaceae bacterium]
MGSQQRRSDLATALKGVRQGIADAAQDAGRDPESVTLVAVTKTWPATDIRLLWELGVRHFGESRHPEAEQKANELADLDGLVWHFVGQIQTNKAARIAGYADVVHSVDSVRLARRLGLGAHRSGRTVRCLVQVSLDPPQQTAGRGGVGEESVEEVAGAIEAGDALLLGGLMGVPPQEIDPLASYRRLESMCRRLVRRYPRATVMSAGMSADYHAAIAAGATHVRVGSAVLGRRPPLG